MWIKMQQSVSYFPCSLHQNPEVDVYIEVFSFPFYFSGIFSFILGESYHHTLQVLQVILPCMCCPQLCLTLFYPTDCSPPGSSVSGIFQARILELVAISFSRGSPWPRDRTHVSCVSKQILYQCGKPLGSPYSPLTPQIFMEVSVISEDIQSFYNICPNSKFLIISITAKKLKKQSGDFHSSNTSNGFVSTNSLC